jgi:hypothetical protein
MIPPSTTVIIDEAAKAERGHRLMLARAGHHGFARAAFAELEDLQESWAHQSWSEHPGNAATWTPDRARAAVRDTVCRLAEDARVPLQQAEAVAAFALLVICVNGVPLAQLVEPVQREAHAHRAGPAEALSLLREAAENLEDCAESAGERHRGLSARIRAFLGRVSTQQ